MECMFFLWYIVFLPIEAVNSSVMCFSISTMPWSPNMQVQKLLTLHWRWFSRCSTECVAVVSTPNGFQNRIYGCLQPIRNQITQDAKLKLVDAQLMLIPTMAQCPCCWLFCLYKLPIRWLCLTGTNQFPNAILTLLQMVDGPLMLISIHWSFNVCCHQ